MTLHCDAFVPNYAALVALAAATGVFAAFVGGVAVVVGIGYRERLRQLLRMVTGESDNG